MGTFTDISTTPIGGNLIPTADNTYDVGSAAKRWRSGYFGTSVILSPTAKAIFDGATASVFISETSDNNLRVTVNNVDAADFGDTVFAIKVDTSISATKKFYLDGGGNTYIHEVSADVLETVIGGTTMLNMQANSINARAGTVYRAYEAANIKYVELKHDGTNAVLASSSGDMVLQAVGTTQLTLKQNALIRWDNGSFAVNVVSPTAPNRTISIDIAGTTYYIAAKTTND